MTVKELWNMALELVGEEELTRRFRVWISTLIRNARMKRENIDSGALFESDVTTILHDLNTRTKCRFGATDSAKNMIGNLLKKGYAPEDFFRVHEVKCLQWIGNEKMEHNLRPSTLYRPSHFDEYLGEWWKLDRERCEREQKRKTYSSGKAVEAPRQENVRQMEREAIVKELNRKAWNQHETWMDFMRWTVRFPDSESLSQYPMPERIRRMRVAPKMLRMIAVGDSPAWAEAEYLALKEAENV